MLTFGLLFCYSGIIRSQSNLADHNITLCKNIPEQWAPEAQPCPYPIFVDGRPAVSIKSN